MYKFFINHNQINENKAKIIGEDVNHIANVLRLKKEEKIIICDKDENISYVAKIKEINREYIKCEIIEQILENIESNVNIDLYQGLPKIDKMEYIIQKATELGVRDIYPVITKRCIVKLDEKLKTKKIERWQKIAEVAAKQSKRDYIPKIENAINLENICQNIEKYDIILLAYEDEANNTLKHELKILAENKTQKIKIGIIIGPEGGLDIEEVNKLKEAGAKIITLGKRILKTETASLVILSDIIYEFEL